MPITPASALGAGRGSLNAVKIIPTTKPVRSERSMIVVHCDMLYHYNTVEVRARLHLPCCVEKLVIQLLQYVQDRLRENPKDKYSNS